MSCCSPSSTSAATFETGAVPSLCGLARWSLLCTCVDLMIMPLSWAELCCLPLHNPMEDRGILWRIALLNKYRAIHIYVATDMC